MQRMGKKSPVISTTNMTPSSIVFLWVLLGRVWGAVAVPNGQGTCRHLIICCYSWIFSIHLLCSLCCFYLCPVSSNKLKATPVNPSEFQRVCHLKKAKVDMPNPCLPSSFLKGLALELAWICTFTLHERSGWDKNRTGKILPNEVITYWLFRQYNFYK